MDDRPPSPSSHARTAAVPDPSRRQHLLPSPLVVPSSTKPRRHLHRNKVLKIVPLKASIDFIDLLLTQFRTGDVLLNFYFFKFL